MSEPAPTPAPEFDKLPPPDPRPEEKLAYPDKHGLRWWLSWAATHFVRGAINAGPMGAGTGAVAGAGTVNLLTLDPATISLNAVVGAAVPILMNGGKYVAFFAKTHPFPNALYPEESQP